MNAHERDWKKQSVINTYIHTMHMQTHIHMGLSSSQPIWFDVFMLCWVCNVSSEHWEHFKPSKLFFKSNLTCWIMCIFYLIRLCNTLNILYNWGYSLLVRRHVQGTIDRLYCTVSCEQLSWRCLLSVCKATLINTFTVKMDRMTMSYVTRFTLSDKPQRIVTWHYSLLHFYVAF